MSDIYKKINKLNSMYGNESSEFDEELVEHLNKNVGFHQNVNFYLD